MASARVAFCSVPVAATSSTRCRGSFCSWCITLPTMCRSCFPARPQNWCRRHSVEVASRNKVFVEMDDTGDGIYVPHIELGRNVDLIVVYPCHREHSRQGCQRYRGRIDFRADLRHRGAGVVPAGYQRRHDQSSGRATEHRAVARGRLYRAAEDRGAGSGDARKHGRDSATFFRSPRCCCRCPRLSPTPRPGALRAGTTRKPSYCGSFAPAQTEPNRRQSH